MGYISDGQSARKFLEEIKQFFAKKIKIYNIASKLKTLKLELDEDMFVYLILVSLPPHFGQFKEILQFRCGKEEERV
ncbi:hypothetical protein Lal_00030009 [Lupinus albus]|nr:hypothetical protein Lal_00030009 [Lupinus albus]